jgi:hypothetical protein
MVHALAAGSTLDKKQCTIVVDSGTGTSAIGAMVLAAWKSPMGMLSPMLLIISRQKLAALVLASTRDSRCLLQGWL